MTKIQEDLEQLVGDSAEAGKICNRIFDQYKDRIAAYAALVNVASDAQVGWVRTVAVLLKYEFERQRVAGEGKSVSTLSSLSEWPVDELFHALEPGAHEQRIFSSDDLTLLLREMVLLGLHAVPNAGDALEYFTSQRRLTIEQLDEADEATRNLFDACKKSWLDLHAECSELNGSCENLTQCIERTRQDFMEIFAVEFLAEREAIARHRMAQRRLAVLNDNPDYSATDIEEHLHRKIDKHKEKLRPEQLSATYGLLLLPNRGVVDNNDDYKTSKTLLRKIAMLVHPDRPNNLSLTRDQRQQFTQIWHDTNTLRMQRNDPSVLCRKTGLLKCMLQLVEQIVAIAGIENLDATLMIQGSSIDERIAWLDRNSEPVDLKIAVMKSELRVRDTERELNYMRAILNAPANERDRALTAMKENASRYRSVTRNLEQNINEMLTASA